MKSFVPVLNGLLLIGLFSAISMFATCSGGSTKKASGEVSRAALQCESNPPIRVHYDTETGMVEQKGPVLLGRLSCERAAKLPVTRLFSFKRDGLWVDYYSGTDKVRMKGRYHKNQRDGEWSVLDKEGNIKQKVTFDNGKKIGQEVSYFKGTDEWKEQGSYQNGEKEGTWQMRGAPDADCISSGEYENDRKTGQWKECGRAQNGDWFVSFSGNYSRGLKSGAATHYFPDGTVQAKGKYRADFNCLQDPPGGDESKCEKRSGAWKMYHPNGKLAASGSYNSSTGLRSGTWTEYYRSGEKMASGPRSHVRNGQWTVWSKSGTILYKLEFEKTEYNPARAIVYQNGRVSAKGPLQFGMLKYNGDNDTIDLIKMKEKGKWVHYNSSGKKVAEGSYMMGRKHGSWKELENGSWVKKSYRMGRPVR